MEATGPVSYLNFDRKAIELMLAAKRGDGLTTIKHVRAVQAQVGQHPHLKYIEARIRSSARSALLQKVSRARKVAESQQWWCNGGREQHYLRKFGRFGGDHSWLRRGITRLTGMSCATRDRVFDVPNSEEWPILEMDLEEEEWQYDPPKPRVNTTWSNPDHPDHLEWLKASGFCDPVQSRPSTSAPARSIMLLYKLRAIIRRLRQVARSARVVPGAKKKLSRYSKLYLNQNAVAKHQMMDEHGEGSTNLVKTNDVIVTEQHGASVAAEEPAPSQISKVSGDIISSFPRIMERPIPFKVAQWSTKDERGDTLQTIRLPSDYVTFTYNMPNGLPFQIHRYYRGDIVVRVQINSNRFMMGQLQVSWFYLDDIDVHFGRRDNVASCSQTLHTLINAGTSNEAVMRIPFRYFKPMMEIGARQDKITPLNMGVLKIKVLNKLQVTSSAYNNCTYMVFIHLDNVEFTGLRTQTNNTPWRATPQMEVAATMVAAELISTAIDKNRDKPTNSANPVYFTPQTAQSWCIGTNESEDLFPLRLTNAQVPHPPSFVDDPFTVSSLACRFGYVGCYTWRQDAASGSCLFSFPAIPMGPEELYYKQVVEDVNSFVVPPVAFISNMFAYWRGSLKMRLDFVATQLHTGRLLIGYVPGDFVSDLTMQQLYASTFAEFDLKEQQQLEFRIPYVADRLYWDRYLNLNVRGSDVMAPGFVYVYVLAPLAIMDSIGNFIEINLYLAAGPDFEVAVPAQPTIGLCFNPSHYVPTSAEAYPIAGYYPFYVGVYSHLDINDNPTYSKGVFFAIFRYGPLYEHVCQFFMGKSRPDYSVGSYYLKLKDFATKGFNIRTGPKFDQKVKPEFFIPWYDGDYVYVMPAVSEVAAKKWCKYMNKNLGDYTKFLSATVKPDLFFYPYPNDDADDYVDADGTMRWEILTESGIVPEEEDGFELVASHQMADNRVSVEGATLHTTSLVSLIGSGHFGESFNDLKNLVRRYQAYSFVGLQKMVFKDYKPGAVLFSFPVYPQGMRLNIKSGEDVNWFSNYAREGHIPLLLSGYRFFRGSVRFRIIFPDADATYFVQHIPAAPWRSEDIVIRDTTAYKLSLDNMINHSNAFTIQIRRINPVLSFEVPYYLPYDSMVLQRFKYSGKHNFRDIVQASFLGEIRVGILAAGKQGDQTSNLYFQIAYSLGDDARPSTFQGFPPVILTQDIPLMAQHQGPIDSIKSIFGAGEAINMLKDLDLNRTAEKTNELLESMQSNSNTFNNALGRIDAFSEKGIQAFEAFIDSMKDSQVPQVIINGLSQVTHVFVNPTPRTMAVAIISFLLSIGVIASSSISKLMSLLLNIFKAPQPQQPNGGEAMATHQIDIDRNDGVALASVLFTGISTALNVKHIQNSKFTKGLGADLMGGLANGSREGSYFFRFLSNIIGVIMKIFDYLKTKLCPVTLGLENMVDDAEIIELWSQEAIQLCDPDIESLFDVYPMLAERVHACYVVGSLIYSKLAGAPKGVNVAVLKDMYSKIVQLKQELADKGICSIVRREPFVICMYGDPGIGKSHLACGVLIKLLKDAKIEYNTCPIYSHPAGAKYWENVGQEPAMLMDDAFVLRSGETADTEVSTMMSLKSCALFTPPIAACERKKKRYSPELVYYHTNMAFPTISNMNCAKAIYRRRDILWNAELIKGKKMSDFTPEQLDKCEHLTFRYHLTPADPENAQAWSEPLDYNTFYRITKEKFINFRNSQIVAHAKKIDLLTATTMELRAYPELNKMPLMTVLKMYQEHSKFDSLHVYRRATDEIIANHQANGLQFVKIIEALPQDYPYIKHVKYICDNAIIDELKPLIKHIRVQGVPYAIPAPVYHILAAISHDSYFSDVCAKLAIISLDGDDVEKIRNWLTAYANKKLPHHVLNEHTFSENVADQIAATALLSGLVDQVMANIDTGASEQPEASAAEFVEGFKEGLEAVQDLLTTSGVRDKAAIPDKNMRPGGRRFMKVTGARPKFATSGIGFKPRREFPARPPPIQQPIPVHPPPGQEPILHHIIKDVDLRLSRLEDAKSVSEGKIDQVYSDLVRVKVAVPEAIEQALKHALEAQQEDNVISTHVNDMYTVEEIHKHYKQFRERNLSKEETKPKICDSHAKMILDHFQIDEINKGNKLVNKAEIDPKRFIENMSQNCPHYFLFLRNLFITEASSLCCMKHTGIRHFCIEKSSKCDKDSCPVMGWLPLLDSWDNCSHGSKCMRFNNSLRKSCQSSYATNRPDTINKIVSRDISIPSILFNITYTERVKSVVYMVRDFFVQIKNCLVNLTKKIWAGLLPVRNFFSKYGKMVMLTLGLIGGGVALYHRESITNYVTNTAAPAVSGAVTDFGAKTKEAYSRLFSKSKSDIVGINDETKLDSEIKANLEEQLQGSHQIISSGDPKAAAKASRISFAAKSINNASILAPKAAHQISHADAVCARIVSNTLTIIACNLENGAPIESTCKIARALALGDRFVLINLHSIEIFKNLELSNLRIFIADRFVDVPLDNVICSTIDKDSTLAVLRMPANFPQFKKIINYFASEADHTLRRPSEGQIISILPNCVTYKDCKLSVRTQVLSIAGLLGASQAEIANVYQYECQAPGMCGSLLLAPKLNAPIIGFHIAGLEETNTGFAEPLFRETFEVLFTGVITDVPQPEFVPLSETKMDLQTTVFPVGGVGKKYAHRSPPKSSIVQSAIFGYVEPKTSPAPLSPSDPRLPPNSSPLIKGCEKHGILTKNFPKKVLDRTYNRMREHLFANCKPLRAGRLVLTDNQAVCGDPQLPYCDPLNWSSSEGYPYSSIRPPGANDKKWLFNLKSKQDGSVELLDYNEPLKSIIIYKRNARADGVVQPTIFVDCLKDARIDKEKCTQPGKTRIISMSPVDYTIDFRKWFYDFISTYQARRMNNFHSIGINVFGKEWDILARKLNTYEDICTGDYSNFGPGLNLEVAKLCMDLILDWYDEFEEDSSADDVRTRACLASELIGSLHLCGDLVYRVVAGVPSGSPITVVLNSLVNTFYLFAAWDMMSVDWPVELRNFSNFCKHIILFTYGDDYIFSVSPVYRDLFNSKTLSEILKKYDIKLTDAFKGAEVTPYNTLEKSTFLKGKFNFFSGQYWYGLDTDQVFDMVNYVKDKHTVVDATLINAEQALLHAHGHGKTFFNEVKSKLTIAFRKKNIPFHGRTFKECTDLKLTTDLDIRYVPSLKFLLPLF